MYSQLLRLPARKTIEDIMNDYINSRETPIDMCVVIISILSICLDISFVFDTTWFIPIKDISKYK